MFRVAAEATPKSTSAVFGTRRHRSPQKPTHRASHRADEVENVVLVPCRDHLAKQVILLACISPHSLGLGRVVPVLPVGPARPLQSLWRSARVRCQRGPTEAPGSAPARLGSMLLLPADRASGQAVGSSYSCPGCTGRARPYTLADGLYQCQGGQDLM